jgi:heme exporter protein C
MRRVPFFLLIVTFFAGFADLSMVFVYAPRERYMGDLQRLMYFHVASAWTAFLAFTIVFLSSLAYLKTRRFKWDRLSVSAAELGVVFTTFVLITGPIWARPVWNAWWTWDPRLTTTLILWFIYIAYLLLRSSTEEEERRGRVAAVFAILGFIDVPIVHFSVTWWRSIHPHVITETEMNMDPAMSLTLWVTGLVFVLIFLLLLSFRLKLEEQRRLLARLRRKIYDSAEQAERGMER